MGNEGEIEDLVVDFYYGLFDRIFSQTFRESIAQRIRRDEVIRRVEESAAAAAPSLIRLLANEQVSVKQTRGLLNGLEPLGELISVEAISNPNVTPPDLIDEVADEVPCPEFLKSEEREPLYGLARYHVVQVVLLVGPVMAQWQKLEFARTFEPPRRVVQRLNEISGQLDALGTAGREAEDERYELTYRDYLLQRFYQVEAGTVKMTTNLSVDLRQLFVMPRVRARRRGKEEGDDEPNDAVDLMELAAARRAYSTRDPSDEGENDESVKYPSALDFVRTHRRAVLIGPPGCGKSTFLEWLQLQIASVEEELVLGGQQAIPLLLRVRQMDVEKLPEGADLIANATASTDQAAIMPQAWIERKLRAGRVLFMLDGMDETDPDIRDRHVLPWLSKLCEEYPDCQFLVSSRPVGYPPGFLRDLEFSESDFADFGKTEIADYCEHWCTAVRLAQNEPEEEAIREGQADGERIVAGFGAHPYIQNLARNPLMLSAICLVNYFEGGQLPTDRALLYQLCVEGLLHHWDQRRGIRSEFTLDEKIRATREVAIAMQAADQAECSSVDVERIFGEVLNDTCRGSELLEHIRYRTGLLLERRTNIFAFAHLTFQEYLAARSVHEGNGLEVDPHQLADEHDDARWREVIALYCGLAPTPAVRDLIEHLLRASSDVRPSVLADAYLSAGAELTHDAEITRRVVEHIAQRSEPSIFNPLQRFPSDIVGPIARKCLGSDESREGITFAYQWIFFSYNRENTKFVDINYLRQRLSSWDKLSPHQLAEIAIAVHCCGSEQDLSEVSKIDRIYASAGPQGYNCMGEIILVGLAWRCNRTGFGVDEAFRNCLLSIAEHGGLQKALSGGVLVQFLTGQEEDGFGDARLPKKWREQAYLPRRKSEYPIFARLVGNTLPSNSELRAAEIKKIERWIEFVEQDLDTSNRRRRSTRRRAKSRKRKTRDDS